MSASPFAAPVTFLPMHRPNACGPCTLCCKVFGIRDIDLIKPKDVWCPHATKGQGCGIYADRPASCREFTCLWLHGNMDASLRPDKIHGVLSTTVDGENLVLHEDAGWPGHARLALRRFIDDFTRSGERFAVVVCGNERQLYGTKERLARVTLRQAEDVIDDAVVDEVASTEG